MSNVIKITLDEPGLPPVVAEWIHHSGNWFTNKHTGGRITLEELFADIKHLDVMQNTESGTKDVKIEFISEDEESKGGDSYVYM
jgi:hypothetical protein